MGFLGSLFSGLGGLGKSLMGGLGNIGSGLMNLFKSPQASQAASVIPQMIGGGRSTYGTGNIPQGFQNRPMPSTSPFGGSQGGGMGGFLSSVFPNSPGAGVGGLATLGLGELFGNRKKARIPDIESRPSVQALRGFDVRKTSPLSPNVEASINRNLDTEFANQKRYLDRLYHSARPGTDFLTDSSYQRDLAELQRKQSLNRADSQANAELENMRVQLGANQQEMQKLQELADLDVFTIMANTGLDAEEANSFKEMFSNVGTMLLNQGTGQNQFLNDLF